MPEMNLAGRLIRRVRRVNYVLPDGRRDRREGPIEFSWGDGSVLLIDSGSDGESLRSSEAEWRDPFAEPLSDENRQFVAEAGKWTAFDVSAEPDYRPFIGARVEQVRPKQWKGVTVGAEIETAAGTIVVEVVADELLVDAHPR